MDLKKNNKIFEKKIGSYFFLQFLAPNCTLSKRNSQKSPKSIPANTHTHTRTHVFVNMQSIYKAKKANVNIGVIK